MAKLAKDRGILSYDKYDNYVTSEEGWEVIKKYIPANFLIMQIKFTRMQTFLLGSPIISIY